MKATKIIGKRKSAVHSRKIIPIWLTSKHVYQGYRYKKRHVVKNPNGTTSVFQPYVKKSEETNHEFSLTFPEWSKIIEEYFKVVFEELMEGNPYKFPRRMGHLIMYKIKKAKSFVIRGGKKYSSFRTMGYSPNMLWHRNREKNFPTKFFYLFNFSRKKLWKLMGKRLKEEPTIIFDYPDMVRKQK